MDDQLRLKILKKLYSSQKMNKQASILKLVFFI